MLSLFDLLSQFPCTYRIISGCDNPSPFISSVGLGMGILNECSSNSAEQMEILRGHAQIGFASDFLPCLRKESFSTVPEIFLLLCNNEDVCKRTDIYANRLPDTTIISIESERTPEELYFHCVNAISKDMEYMHKLVSNHYLHLADLLTRDVEISEIEEVANKILGNPMIITDESYKVMTHSKREKVDDPIWSTIIENTYCPSPIVEMTNHNHFWKRLKKHGQPLFVDSGDFSPFIRRAVAQIKSERKTKGYIALLEVNKPITERDLNVLQMVAELIGVKLKEKDAISKAMGKMESEFIHDLFSSTMNNEKMAQNRARSLGWRIQPIYSVLCIHGNEKDRYIGPVLEMVKTKLLSHFPFCVYSFTGEHGYFLVGYGEHQSLEISKKNIIRKMMEDSKLVCYAGLPVGKLIAVGESYAQAQNSFHVQQLFSEKNAKKSFYCYSEMAVYDLLLNLTQKEFKHSLSSRALMSLIRIDKEEGSDYVETLRHFFENNQNVAATAEAMYLHRNTVNYRLNKIRQLLDNDFDNPTVRLHLYLSLLMLDLGLLTQ